MEGVIDATSVPMVENRPVFGPELPPSQKKDEATMETAQTRMDNESEISIEGSTVKIGSSNATEASLTLVATASNSGSTGDFSCAFQGGNLRKKNKYDIKNHSKKDLNICILYYTHIGRSLKLWIVCGRYCDSDN